MMGTLVVKELSSFIIDVRQGPKYIGKPEKVAVVNSFIYANFNYCLFVWHVSICEWIRKIEKTKSVA